MKNLAGLSLILFLVLVCLAPSSVCRVANAGTLITEEKFENSISSYWYRAMNNYSYSGTYITSPFVSPTHAFRIELHSSDSEVEGGMRAELESEPETRLQERTYNFNIMLPGGGEDDYALDNYDCDEIIAQWHNNPDSGEDWTMPPLALTTTTNEKAEGRYVLLNLWDDAAKSTTEEMKSEGKISYYDLGSYTEDKGKWVKWTFHVKWGWLSSHNTILEVYKNGSLIFSHNGYPNTTDDQKGVNQQFGIYKWEWDGSGSDSKLSKRVIYFDDVSVYQGWEAPGSTSNPPATTYTVTVNNGLGGGTYSAGEEVTIVANLPVSGKAFDRWTGRHSIS